MNKYIAIEGNIGAGKTTLATYISSLLGVELILENFENNPYLDEFYQNQRRNAVDTETFFLKDRIRQLNSIQKGKGYIADFSLLKSSVFAHVNLSKNELKNFNQIFQNGWNALPSPDVILFLKNDIHDLQRKITDRSRVIERNIENEYLEAIENEYLEKLANLHSIPVFYLESKNIFFPYELAQIKQIVNYLLNAEHKGVMEIIDL